MATYPAVWPETVRALLVHSARTRTMREHLNRATKRGEKDAFRRRYGMGVPDLVRATRSASDALTLLSQEVIEPFDGQGRTRQLHLHDLPWPAEVLSDLGDAKVELRGHALLLRRAQPSCPGLAAPLQLPVARPAIRPSPGHRVHPRLPQAHQRPGPPRDARRIPRGRLVEGEQVTRPQ